MGLGDYDLPGQFYLPISQSPGPLPQYVLIVRTVGSASDLVDPIRRVLQPILPVSTVRTFDSMLAPQTRGWRLGRSLFGACGVLALTLCLAGVYTVVAYSLRMRKLEFAIRRALGAKPRDVVLAGISGIPMTIGIGLGLAGLVSLAGSRFLVPLQYQRSNAMLGSFFVAAVTIIAGILSATLIAVYRETSSDPSEAIRSA